MPVIMLHTESIVDNYMFRRLYRQGKNIVTPQVAIYYKKNRLDHNRMGITTSKKIGNAVQRNRAKRVIREAYRLLEPELPMGYDYVLVARKKTVFSKMQDVKSSLEKALLS